jgi:hypothetical protein
MYLKNQSAAMSAHDVSVAAAKQWEDMPKANASSDHSKRRERQGASEESSSESPSSDSSDTEKSPEEGSDSSVERCSTLDDDQPLIPLSRAKAARFD